MVQFYTKKKQQQVIIKINNIFNYLFFYLYTHTKTTHDAFASLALCVVASVVALAKCF